MALFHTFLMVSLVGFGVSAPPVDSDTAAYDLESYDVDSDAWDLNTYGETYDYDDLDEEVRGWIKKWQLHKALVGFRILNIIWFE